MSDRGMKKWAPYKSLIEQDAYLNKMRKEKEKISKPKISNEEAENINEILTTYHGEELEISYFRNEEILKENIVIKTIDVINKKLLLLNRRVIYFKEIISLKRID